MIFDVSIQESIGTLCFLAAIVHTFSVKQFQHLALRYPLGSEKYNFFKMMGEVEVVFGVWASIFLAFLFLYDGSAGTIQYLETRNFREPIFVFVIMALCSTQPILKQVTKIIDSLSQLLPLKRSIAFYFSCLTIGPLMGSFVTEPAAMTVISMVLLERFFKKKMSEKWMYSTFGLLLVNVSIGGTLTPYASPPVLMVASEWQWGMDYFFKNFAWKTLIAILISTSFLTFWLRDEIARVEWNQGRSQGRDSIPKWVHLAHFCFLGLIVLSAHSISVFVGVFLLFLGLFTVTRSYQSEIKLKDGLLVAFFLGGLLILGDYQKWWIEPLLSRLSSFSLFIGGTLLTSITDNAMLTYLGSLVPTLSANSKYALVAGAVTGGGLTIIANAPNPIAFGILNSEFGEEGISPFLLFKYALFPTCVAGVCYWFF